LITIYFLAKVFTKIADFAFLGWLNRFVGAIIGLLRMFLFLSVFLSISNKITSEFIPKSIQNQSVFYHPILKASKIIFPVLQNSFDELKNKIEI
jgi:membrane protein required for colicin V production